MANKTTYLGEFEQVVMLSVLSLNDDAYGVTIREHLNKSIQRQVSIGALYATTDRLEKKGLLSSRKGKASAERGGKAKRYYLVTAEGIAALQESKRQLESLWTDAKLPTLHSILEPAL